MYRELLQLIPHIQYGNFGGLWRSKKNAEPIDDLDACFKEHDMRSEAARIIRRDADIELANSLQKQMKYARWYGPAYHWLAKQIFRKGI